jgi:3-hydroxyacyl-CoA dehydrogenase
VPQVIERRDGDILILEIDNPPVNALSLPVRRQLMAALQAAAADGSVRVIVLAGANGTFIAGADIREVASGVSRQSPNLPQINAALESSPRPVIAAIEGAALGGGFEMALSCQWRVAARQARVGLPEVRLGLLPGAGGTQRLTRLVGPERALELMLSGEHVPASRALELGMVDVLAQEALPEAVDFARRLRETRPPISECDEKLAGVTAALFAAARKKIERKARGQLAPWRIIDCVEAAWLRPKAEAFQFERACFIELADSAQHKALTHRFFAEREARKVPGVAADVIPQPVRAAAVVGGGTMGGGIAMCFANAGIPVKMLEVSAEALERGLGLVRGNYDASVRRGSLSRERADQALSLIHGVTSYEALGEVDIVIEAVFEDMKIKQEVFARLDKVTPPHAILATNTSTLDIDVIATATSRPDKVVGTHFFSPANVMKLLENVRGSRSSPQTLVTVMALGRALGKVTVMAGNCDGFIGNRMFQYYTGEAEFLLEDGATPEQIDRVMEEFGFPMGPLAVRDLAGNDVGYRIRQHRQQTGGLPDDERTSPILGRLVEQGRLGQKAGKGYYRYEGRNRLPDPEVLALIEAVSRELGIARRSISDGEILTRLLHPLVNEGAKILEDGISMRASDIDVVYVNGYGFPAWKGGPMYWAETEGLDRVVAIMRVLAPRRGARWKPSVLLERLAREGQGWSSLHSG